MNLQKPHSSSSSSSPTFSAPSGASFFDSFDAAGAVFASVAMSLASRSKLWRGQETELVQSAGGGEHCTVHARSQATRYEGK